MRMYSGGGVPAHAMNFSSAIVTSCGKVTLNMAHISHWTELDPASKYF